MWKLVGYGHNDDVAPANSKSGSAAGTQKSSESASGSAPTSGSKKKYCPNCGDECQPHHKFCGGCGTNLKS